MKIGSLLGRLIVIMLLVYPMMAQSVARPSTGRAQNVAVSWSSFNMGFAVPGGTTTLLPSAVGQDFVGPAGQGDTYVESGLLVIILRKESTVSIDEVDGLPLAYALNQNFPNPFNPQTTIRFALPAATEIRIVVYDLLGREVVRLVDGLMQPGYHQLVWNGRDAWGRVVPTGIYITRLITSEYTKSIKMVLLK